LGNLHHSTNLPYLQCDFEKRKGKCKMSNLEFHARNEFRAAGWTDENGNFKDEMQEAICNDVLKLIEVFSEQGHSGTSATYAISLFKTLASFKPIVPLTGEDWEWGDVTELSGKTLWQNKRCSHVFKDNDGAYDNDGIVWWEWYTNPETGEKFKSHFTNYESRVSVTFPYTPKTEYKEWVEK
jgi:hypothetical protein